MRIHIQAFHSNDLSFTNHILHTSNSRVLQFGDVAQALGAGEDFHKRSEIGDSSDFTLVNLSDFGLRNNLIDDINGLVRTGLIRRRNVDRTIILNINLNSRAIDDRSDRFSATSNDLSDLLWLHLECENPWRIRRYGIHWL